MFLWPRREERENEKKQEMCSYCGGAGRVTCGDCGGSGEESSYHHFTCTSCDGRGEVYCPACSGLGYTEE